jgi:hypothetical protein
MSTSFDWGCQFGGLGQIGPAKGNRIDYVVFWELFVTSTMIHQLICNQSLWMLLNLKSCWICQSFFFSRSIKHFRNLGTLRPWTSILTLTEILIFNFFALRILICTFAWIARQRDFQISVLQELTWRQVAECFGGSSFLNWRNRNGRTLKVGWH